MCYSPAASWAALGAAAAGCAALVLVGQRGLAAFCAYVALMQAFDLFFWAHPGRTPANAAATKAAMVVNHLQPLALAAAAVWVDGRRLRPLSAALLAAYAAYAAIYTAVAWRRVTHTVVAAPAAPGLLWQWNYLPGSGPMYALYLAAACAVAWQHFAPPVNAVLVAFVAATFALSLARFKARSDVGRMWCWVGNLLPATAAAAAAVAARR